MEDVSAAEWIRSRLHPFSQDVGSVIPEGFEAYGRLFHPIESGGAAERERWSDLARRNGRIVHPEMQLHWISRPLGQRPPSEYDRGDGPAWGSLPLQERRILVEIMARHTTTPDVCWFGVWEGYGPLEKDEQVEWHRAGTLGALRARLRRRSPRPRMPSLPQLELPHRSYCLYRGPIEKALAPLAFDQSPNLWWPEDHTWFVATEVDYAWTYIGGTQHLLDELISDERLEVLPAGPSDQPFYGSDLLNAAAGPE